MAYLHTLSGWQELHILFEDNNLILDTDNDNKPIVYTKDDDCDIVEYHELPEHLRQALTTFEKRHKL